MARVALTTVRPTVGTPIQVNCADAETVEVQISGLSGGDTITVARSLNTDAFVAWQLLTADYDLADNPLTADGIYNTVGGGVFRFTKTGTASSPSVTVAQSVS